MRVIWQEPTSDIHGVFLLLLLLLLTSLLATEYLSVWLHSIENSFRKLQPKRQQSLYQINHLKTSGENLSPELNFLRVLKKNNKSDQKSKSWCLTVQRENNCVFHEVFNSNSIFRTILWLEFHHMWPCYIISYAFVLIRYFFEKRHFKFCLRCICRSSVTKNMCRTLIKKFTQPYSMYTKIDNQQCEFGVKWSPKSWERSQLHHVITSFHHIISSHQCHWIIGSARYCTLGQWKICKHCIIIHLVFTWNWNRLAWACAKKVNVFGAHFIWILIQYWPRFIFAFIHSSHGSNSNV